MDNNNYKSTPCEEYTVSRLSNLIKKSIEQNFKNICLKAEVSALKIHSSGHIYFSLKDADSVINAICWKWTVSRNAIKLEEGMQIKCFGQVTTFPQQSKYQFILENFELAGIGELLKILEERKKKLTAEGLFDAHKKKALPFIPKIIGIVTSPTGAVIRDMIHRIKERFPTEIILWPVAVQGVGASEQIETAIDGLNNLQAPHKPDVIIVARGGGSFEDLMPFNEENVVRAVARSKIPIISAIGHETDTTLIDYAADVRAPTPTAAAEFAVPERNKIMESVKQMFSKLNIIILNKLERQNLYLKSHKIHNISSLVEDKIQKIDFIFEKTKNVLTKNISNKRLYLYNITIEKPNINYKNDEMFKKLEYQFLTFFEKLSSKHNLLIERLESNAYVNILKKGFVLAQADNGNAVKTVEDAKKHHKFELNFVDGTVKVALTPSQETLF